MPTNPVDVNPPGPMAAVYVPLNTKNRLATKKAITKVKVSAPTTSNALLPLIRYKPLPS